MRERFIDYNPPISAELKDQYETALHGELRWQGGFLVTDKEESDLDHVKSMFDIHDEVSSKFPALFSEINSADTAPMIYLHDAGEILAHDMPHGIPNYDVLRPLRKKREAAAFRLLTRKHIGDIELRAYTRELFNRYEKLDPNDGVAQYVRIVDHLQATRFGAVNVFHGSNLSRQQRLQQINHIAHLYEDPCQNLYSFLSKMGKENLLEWMDEEFKVLTKNGYKTNEISPYRKGLRKLLISTGNSQ